MPDAVLNAMKRKLAAYEAAGLDDKADATRARIEQREQAQPVPVEEPRSWQEMSRAELVDAATQAGVEVRPYMPRAKLIEALTGQEEDDGDEHTHPGLHGPSVAERESGGDGPGEGLPGSEHDSDS